MQKTITGTPTVIARSSGGDYSRKSRLLFTVVGAGTVYICSDPNVTPATGVPVSAGQYVSDEGLWNGETIYGVTAGESVDLRFLPLGASIKQS